MKRILGISSDSRQKRSFILEDGTQFTFTMYFCPLQQGWFITNLTYGEFVINGLRICNSPNMLYQFKNQLPFGLACQTTGNREPGLQQDFSSGASNIYVLTEDEVAEYTEFLSGS